MTRPSVHSQAQTPSPRAALALAGIETVATLAIAIWLGGVLALGAFAAPTVFGLLERESAGLVMGTIFSRFDRLGLILALLIATAEAARRVMERDQGALGHARAALAGILVLLMLIMSVWLDPAINEMFLHGTRRGVGEAGARLDTLHDWAERAGKLAALAAAAWIAIGVYQRRRQSPHSHPTEPGSTRAR